MSEFSCPVVRVKIEAHPSADAIEIARIGDFQSIARKGQFQDGDLAVYIPEQAVVPEWLLREMGMYDEDRKKGGLAGSMGNRVKAIKLRGVVSQGLILTGCQYGDVSGRPLLIVSCPTTDGMRLSTPFGEGEDAAKFLGITKYEPKIPSHMAGRAIGVDFGATHKYDFENIKKHPEMFSEDDYVVMTEKLHGTLMCVGIVPTVDANEKYYRGRVIITSKGLGGNGVILDHADETNLYAQAANKHGLLDAVYDVLGEIADRENKPVLMFGEVFGKTLGGADIQDLTYTDEQADYRAFDICIGNRGTEQFFSHASLVALCEKMDVQIVPVVYEGKWDKEVMLFATNGMTTMGDSKHIREGVVVKCAFSSCHPHYGRKIAKSISDAYLTRKNGTELN